MYTICSKNRAKWRKMKKEERKMGRKELKSGKIGDRGWAFG